MSIAIRYYSKTNNTEKLCNAVADVVGVEAKTVAAPLSEPVDQLVLGASVYKYGIDESVKTFLSENANKIGTLYLVSSAALITSSMKQVKDYCSKLGITVSDNDFHCKGQFLQFHKGKPDENDIKACAAWAERTFK